MSYFSKLSSLSLLGVLSNCAEQCRTGILWRIWGRAMPSFNLWRFSSSTTGGESKQELVHILLLTRAFAQNEREERVFQAPWKALEVFPVDLTSTRAAQPCLWFNSTLLIKYLTELTINLVPTSLKLIQEEKSHLTYCYMFQYWLLSNIIFREHTTFHCGLNFWLYYPGLVYSSIVVLT